MKKEVRGRYLNRSADLVSRAAFNLCRKSLASKEDTDAKMLKELCCVLKEIIAINTSLDKDSTDTGETIRIIMEGDVSELAR
ncbi:MAG: hypothetical protein IKJ88_06605 [Clostridia bacterium]|nr:hypothetical protein [Clostridia bacterium]